MDSDEKLVEDAAEVAAKKAARAIADGPAAVEKAVRTELRQVLHRHPQELESQHTLTFGERWAGRVARASGNWKTILPYLGITALYLVINHWIYPFDQTLQYYTFAVSVLAIFLAQVILLFQNRQSDLESKLAHNAYHQTAEIFALQEQQVAGMSHAGIVFCPITSAMRSEKRRSALEGSETHHAHVSRAGKEQATQHLQRGGKSVACFLLAVQCYS